MEPIEIHLKEFVTTYNQHNVPLYVGVSGGADSMALLVALKRCSIAVIALHVNFHLRGDESNQDQQFVEKFCKENNIECRTLNCNTADYAQVQGISIEMAARELRYNWFKKECGQDGLILIAHNSDDVAETILLNQIRGTGIAGLCGIREKNGNILRPLLKYRHCELLNYLEKCGIPHCEDSTNKKNIAKRNILRNSLFPILKELNPSVVETLCKNAERMQGVEAIYREEIKRVTSEILSKPISAIGNAEEVIKINIERLMNVASPITMAFEILSPLGFNEEQITNFIELTKDVNSGKQLISNNYRVLFERDGVYITANNQVSQEEILLTSLNELETPIKTTIGELHFQIISGGINISEIKKDKNYAYFDLDKIEFPLTIRGINKGDKIKPFGMNGCTKLISDILNDIKINSYEREKIPLLLDSNGIMWIIGIRACHNLKVTKQTQRVLVVKIQYP